MKTKAVKEPGNLLRQFEGLAIDDRIDLLVPVKSGVNKIAFRNKDVLYCVRPPEWPEAQQLMTCALVSRTAGRSSVHSYDFCIVDSAIVAAFIIVHPS